MEQITTTETALKAVLSNIESQSQQLLKSDDLRVNISQLSEHLAYVATEAIAAADAITIDDDSPDTSYILRYEWPVIVKDYLILLRNVSIQILRADQIALDQVAQLRSESNVVIQSAASAVVEHVAAMQDQLSQAGEKSKSLRSKWHTINDPWPTLKRQIETLQLQGAGLVRQVDDASAIRKVVDGIRSNLSRYIDYGVGLLSANDQCVDAAKTCIAQYSQEGKIGKIASEIQQQEELLPARKTFVQLSNEIDDLLSTHSGVAEVPVKLYGSEVIIKEIDLHRSAKAWLEAEAYPLIYELDDILRRSNNDRTVTTVNLCNTANLLAKREADKEEIELSDELFGGPIAAYQEKKHINWSEYQHIKEELEERIVTGISIDQLYSVESSIFEVSLESSFKTIGIRQNRFFQSLKNWGLSKLGFIGDYFDRAQGEQELSVAEKVSRHIQHIDNPNKSSSYANIFLTKGFIGESFVVGRDTEIRRIETAFAAWQDGQRGTVLLSGHRMSGRTLMGELVSATLFAKNTIRLVPGRSYTIAGRTYTCGHDLSVPLGQIVKYGLRSRVMVLIDNAELWHDHNTTLIANMRSLVKTMDSYGDKIFFVVSTTHWVNNYLHHHLEWKDGYQLSINLDSLTRDQLAEAISIRHAATHKTLIDQEGERVTSYAFRRQCDRIHRRSEGIIGEALYAWANTIYDDEEGSPTVHQRIGPYHRLPGIVTSTTGPVLKTMVMYRKINEYQMSKILGSAFSELYRPVVKRYGQIGILGRKADNRLHIYSLLVNDIARQLHKDQWINQDY